MSEEKKLPSRFEVFFNSCSPIQQSSIISIMCILALSPFMNLIGVSTLFLMSISVGVVYFLQYRLSTIDTEKKEEIKESEQLMETESEKEKITFSISDLRQLRKKVKPAFPFIQYRVIRLRPSSRSATPIAFHARDSSNNSYRRVSSRSASPMIFYTCGEPRPISRSATPSVRPSDNLDMSSTNPISTRSKTPEDLMDYYHDDPDTLPKGELTGRIQWMHQNNGRIRTTGRILSSRDLFFHFNDVELKEGQVLDVGDRVIFNVSVFNNLVCATHIRKLENTRSKSAINIMPK